MDCGSLRRRRGSAAFALLRTRSERPDGCRAAEQRDELPPFSLDHLVGAGEQHGREFEAKLLRSF